MWKVCSGPGLCSFMGLLGLRNWSNELETSESSAKQQKKDVETRSILLQP